MEYIKHIETNFIEYRLLISYIEANGRVGEDNKVHALKLNVEDSVFDKVLYLLKSLPDGDVEILLDESTKANRETGKSSIDFSKYNIESFTKIKNSVKWQRLLRDEWER